MSAIDLEIDRFFGEIASTRFDILDLERWCRTYESFNYPDWTMRDGNTIKLSNMTETHIDNTINMLKRKNPDDGWIKILEQEKQYRRKKEQIRQLQCDLSRMREVVDTVF